VLQLRLDWFVGNARRALRDLAPTVAIANVTTLADQVDASILPERMMAMLSELFGVTAALLDRPSRRYLRIDWST